MPAGSTRTSDSPARVRSAASTTASDGSRASAQRPASTFEQWTPSAANRQIRQLVSTISSACSASSVSRCQRARCSSP